MAPTGVIFVMALFSVFSRKSEKPDFTVSEAIDAFMHYHRNDGKIFAILQSIADFLSLLLLVQGIEPNPGPLAFGISNDDIDLRKKERPPGAPGLIQINRGQLTSLEEEELKSIPCVDSALSAPRLPPAGGDDVEIDENLDSDWDDDTTSSPNIKLDDDFIKQFSRPETVSGPSLDDDFCSTASSESISNIKKGACSDAFMSTVKSLKPARGPNNSRDQMTRADPLMDNNFCNYSTTDSDSDDIIKVKPTNGPRKDITKPPKNKEKHAEPVRPSSHGADMFPQDDAVIDGESDWDSFVSETHDKDSQAKTDLNLITMPYSSDTNMCPKGYKDTNNNYWDSDTDTSVDEQAKHTGKVSKQLSNRSLSKKRPENKQCPPDETDTCTKAKRDWKNTDKTDLQLSISSSQERLENLICPPDDTDANAENGWDTASDKSGSEKKERTKLNDKTNLQLICMPDSFDSKKCPKDIDVNDGSDWDSDDNDVPALQTGLQDYQIYPSSSQERLENLICPPDDTYIKPKKTKKVKHTETTNLQLISMPDSFETKYFSKDGSVASEKLSKNKVRREKQNGQRDLQPISSQERLERMICPLEDSDLNEESKTVSSVNQTVGLFYNKKEKMNHKKTNFKLITMPDSYDSNVCSKDDNETNEGSDWDADDIDDSGGLSKNKINTANQNRQLGVQLTPRNLSQERLENKLCPPDGKDINAKKDWNSATNKSINSVNKMKRTVKNSEKISDDDWDNSELEALLNSPSKERKSTKEKIKKTDEDRDDRKLKAILNSPRKESKKATTKTKDDADDWDDSDLEALLNSTSKERKSTKEKAKKNNDDRDNSKLDSFLNSPRKQIKSTKENNKKKYDEWDNNKLDSLPNSSWKGRNSTKEKNKDDADDWDDSELEALLNSTSKERKSTKEKVKKTYDDWDKSKPKAVLNSPRKQIKSTKEKNKNNFDEWDNSKIEALLNTTSKESKKAKEINEDNDLDWIDRMVDSIIVKPKDNLSSSVPKDTKPNRSEDADIDWDDIDSILNTTSEKSNDSIDQKSTSKDRKHIKIGKQTNSKDAPTRRSQKHSNLANDKDSSNTKSTLRKSSMKTYDGEYDVDDIDSIMNTSLERNNECNNKKSNCNSISSKAITAKDRSKTCLDTEEERSDMSDTDISDIIKEVIDAVKDEQTSKQKEVACTTNAGSLSNEKIKDTEAEDSSLNDKSMTSKRIIYKAKSPAKKSDIPKTCIDTDDEPIDWGDDLDVPAAKPPVPIEICTPNSSTEDDQDDFHKASKLSKRSAGNVITRLVPSNILKACIDTGNTESESSGSKSDSSTNQLPLPSTSLNVYDREIVMNDENIDYEEIILPAKNVDDDNLTCSSSSQDFSDVTSFDSETSKRKHRKSWLKRLRQMFKLRRKRAKNTSELDISEKKHKMSLKERFNVKRMINLKERFKFISNKDKDSTEKENSEKRQKMSLKERFNLILNKDKDTNDKDKGEKKQKMSFRERFRLGRNKDKGTSEKDKSEKKHKMSLIERFKLRRNKENDTTKEDKSSENENDTEKKDLSILPSPNVDDDNLSSSSASQDFSDVTSTDSVTSNRKHRKSWMKRFRQKIKLSRKKEQNTSDADISEKKHKMSLKERFNLRRMTNLKERFKFMSNKDKNTTEKDKTEKKHKLSLKERFKFIRNKDKDTAEKDSTEKKHKMSLKEIFKLGRKKDKDTQKKDKGIDKKDKRIKKEKETGKKDKSEKKHKETDKKDKKGKKDKDQSKKDKSSKKDINKKDKSSKKDKDTTKKVKGSKKDKDTNKKDKSSKKDKDTNKKDKSSKKDKDTTKKDKSSKKDKDQTKKNKGSKKDKETTKKDKSSKKHKDTDKKDKKSKKDKDSTKKDKSRKKDKDQSKKDKGSKKDKETTKKDKSSKKDKDTDKKDKESKKDKNSVKKDKSEDKHKKDLKQKSESSGEKDKDPTVPAKSDKKDKDATKKDSSEKKHKKDSKQRSKNTRKFGLKQFLNKFKRKKKSRKRCSSESDVTTESIDEDAQTQEDQTENDDCDTQSDNLSETTPESTQESSTSDDTTTRTSSQQSTTFEDTVTSKSTQESSTSEYTVTSKPTQQPSNSELAAQATSGVSIEKSNTKSTKVLQMSCQPQVDIAPIENQDECTPLVNDSVVICSVRSESFPKPTTKTLRHSLLSEGSARINSSVITTTCNSKPEKVLQMSSQLHVDIPPIENRKVFTLLGNDSVALRSFSYNSFSDDYKDTNVFRDKGRYVNNTSILEIHNEDAFNSENNRVTPVDHRDIDLKFLDDCKPEKEIPDVDINDKASNGNENQRKPGIDNTNNDLHLKLPMYDKDAQCKDMNQKLVATNRMHGSTRFTDNVNAHFRNTITNEHFGVSTLSERIPTDANQRKISINHKDTAGFNVVKRDNSCCTQIRKGCNKCTLGEETKVVGISSRNGAMRSSNQSHANKNGSLVINIQNLKMNINQIQDTMKFDKTSACERVYCKSSKDRVCENVNTYGASVPVLDDGTKSSSNDITMQNVRKRRLLPETHAKKSEPKPCASVSKDIHHSCKWRPVDSPALKSVVDNNLIPVKELPRDEIVPLSNSRITEQHSVENRRGTKRKWQSSRKISNKQNVKIVRSKSDVSSDVNPRNGDRDTYTQRSTKGKAIIQKERIPNEKKTVGFAEPETNKSTMSMFFQPECDASSNDNSQSNNPLASNKPDSVVTKLVKLIRQEIDDVLDNKFERTDFDDIGKDDNQTEADCKTSMVDPYADIKPEYLSMINVKKEIKVMSENIKTDSDNLAVDHKNTKERKTKKNESRVLGFLRRLFK